MLRANMVSVVAVLLGVLLLVALVEGVASGAHGGDGGHLLLDPVAVLVLGVLLGLVLLMLQSHAGTDAYANQELNHAWIYMQFKEINWITADQSVCAGGNGTKAAELLHVLVVLLLLLVVDLAGALLLLVVVEQVVVVLLLGHDLLVKERFKYTILCKVIRGEMIVGFLDGETVVPNGQHL